MSSSWYRTFAAFSLLALLTIWPTLSGLTGLGVSQLVSAIFTIPTWTSDTQDSGGRRLLSPSHLVPARAGPEDGAGDAPAAAVYEDAVPAPEDVLVAY